jgi:serine/threonine protein kinase
MRTVTAQQWERISEVFAEASRLPPDQRDAFLVQVCPDELIRQHVYSLLAQPRRFLGIDPTVTGRTLRQYRVIEQIGHGSMGQVYKAHDMSLDRIVALKLVPSDVRSNPSFRNRLNREAKFASQLNHPNIVVIHDIAHDDKEDLDFIVMEYVSGKTLGAAIPPEGMPVGEAFDCSLQIATALAFAHDSGFLHGDLKPANIMITETGHVKLLDFGLARSLTAEINDPRKSDLFGTIAFMAPERQGALLTDPRSEIFSFGLILHEMLSGRHPFGDGTPDEISVAIKNEEPRMLPPQVPEWLAEIVFRCLEKKVEDRYQSMQEVLSGLRSGGGHNTTTVSTPASPGGRHGDQEKIQAIAARITYGNVARSREALRELADLLAHDPSGSARDSVTSALRDVILTLDMDGNVVGATVRKVRKLTLDTLKTSTAGNLGACFKDGELEELDLFAMDFAGAEVRGISFKGCFLAEADFRRSNLAGARFQEAKIRNVDFTDASLSDADFTDADWFNALGLTEGQLTQVRRNSLLDCPADEQAMHRYLADHYVLPFGSWPSLSQSQLKATWAGYLRPGGLRDIVAELKGTP